MILHERLLRNLRQRREELINLLLSENTNFDNYRFYTGKIKGIDDSIEIIKGVFRGIDEIDG
jgi:hypothetical protein